MSYYFLDARSEPGDPFAQDISIPDSYEHFYLGQKLPQLRKPIRITVSKPKHDLPDLIQGPYTYLIASDRLRQLFELLDPSNIQAAPVDLFFKSKEIAKYHFIQVLNNIDAIEWSQSDLDSYPEDKYSIVAVRKLVLDPRAIGQRNVFRLDGLSTDLGVSDLFRRRVLDAHMTGMRFMPVDDFRVS